MISLSGRFCSLLMMMGAIVLNVFNSLSSESDTSVLEPAVQIRTQRTHMNYFIYGLHFLNHIDVSWDDRWISIKNARSMNETQSYFLVERNKIKTASFPTTYFFFLENRTKKSNKKPKQQNNLFVFIKLIENHNHFVGWCVRLNSFRLDSQSSIMPVIMTVLYSSFYFYFYFYLTGRKTQKLLTKTDNSIQQCNRNDK